MSKPRTRKGGKSRSRSQTLRKQKNVQKLKVQHKKTVAKPPKHRKTVVRGSKHKKAEVRQSKRRKVVARQPKHAPFQGTPIDKVYDTILQKGKLKIKEITKAFKVSKEIAEEWANILEEHNLIGIHYPTFGSPVLLRKDATKVVEQHTSSLEKLAVDAENKLKSGAKAEALKLAKQVAKEYEALPAKEQRKAYPRLKKLFKRVKK